VSDTSITLAAASEGVIADNNTFVVQNYLPDSPAAQEKQAIIHFPTASSPCIKIADFNWELADGISLTAGWASGGGAVAANDTVEVAIEKLENAILDLVTISGAARNATVLGAFASPGSIFLGASLTIKSALQALGDLHTQLRGVNSTGITAEADVDSVIVDDVKSVKWLVHAFEEATPANVRSWEVYALHNGTAGADATLVDHNSFSKLKLGSNFNAVLVVDINGAAGSQIMRLRASSGSAGITVTARRMEVRKNIL